MERLDCAYLINTTPKYFYLLEAHITLLKRYADGMKWPIFIATEEKAGLPRLPDDIQILELIQENAGFFESRAEAMRLLPPSIRYVFPIQDDFLLEGRPMEKVIKEGLEILDRYPIVNSLRLMPCPGPNLRNMDFLETDWKILDFSVDSLVFTYQATLWRREAYYSFMTALIRKMNTTYPHFTQAQRVTYAIKTNLAEIQAGQKILKESSPQSLHLAYPRRGVHPNAVYLCPWPYRPTAVVGGILEPWVRDLAEREGVSLRVPSLSLSHQHSPVGRRQDHPSFL